MKNPHLSYFRAIALLVLSYSAVYSTQAQLLVPISDKTPYYIDVNAAVKSDIHDLQNGLLHLKYHDKFGTMKEIPIRIYNWKQQIVGTFKLEKSFGLNHYSIDLNDKAQILEIDKIYYVVMHDEGGNRYEWSFKNITPVKSDISIDIVVNPLRLSCSDLQGNLVEFYGNIRNGVAPFVVRWFVLNGVKTDFLYQPTESKVPAGGLTTVIQVDKSPAYHVLMDVTDACGTNTRKMVFLECKADKDRISTVFVEPIDLDPAFPTPSQ